MKIIRKIIENNLTGKKVLWLFVITNLVYAIMLLLTIPKTMKYSNGMKLLDMMPMGYDSEYIHSLFEALGENGRHAYLYVQLPVDLIYPFLFGISYCLLIGYFLKKIDKITTAYFYLCLLPIIAGTADYFENFGIINMLINYPNLSQTTMNATAVFSIAKSLTTTAFFIVLIIIIVMFGIKTMRERITRANKEMS